jgi:hypothetical protein
MSTTKQHDFLNRLLSISSSSFYLLSPISFSYITLIVLALSCSASVEMFTSGGDVLKAMYQQGLEGGTVMPADQRTSLADNSPSNVLSELGCVDLAASLQRGLRTDGASNAPAYKLFAFWDAHGLTVQPAFKPAAAPASETRLLCDLLERYSALRLSGHSRAYALRSVEAGGPKEPGAYESVPERLARLHHIPPNYLHKSASDNSYYVIDGPIAWVYNSPLPEATEQDAREYDPAFRAKLDSARSEVESSAGTPAGARAYYAAVQAIMKRNYGLDWLSPLDLNPGLQIDFAPRRSR